MRPPPSLSSLFSVVIACLLAQTAWSADSLAQRIEACAQQRDDAARLRCFDREATTLRAERAPANAAAAPATTNGTAERPPANAVADRKTAEPSRPSRTVAARDTPVVDQPVTARIVSISKTPGLERRIELDNGQVWQENEHDKALMLAEGDNVQIKPGALRSFVMRVPSGARTHVRRVR